MGACAHAPSSATFRRFIESWYEPRRSRGRISVGSWVDERGCIQTFRRVRRPVRTAFEIHTYTLQSGILTALRQTAGLGKSSTQE